MDHVNLDEVEFEIKHVNRYGSYVYRRIKYYLDELCKIKNSDLDKLLTYLQLESYCQCLLDLNCISPRTYDKILSINYKEVLKHDD